MRTWPPATKRLVTKGMQKSAVGGRVSFRTCIQAQGGTAPKGEKSRYRLRFVYAHRMRPCCSKLPGSQLPRTCALPKRWALEGPVACLCACEYRERLGYSCELPGIPEAAPSIPKPFRMLRTPSFAKCPYRRGLRHFLALDRR